jgi:triosephosphate isomerase
MRSVLRATRPGIDCVGDGTNVEEPAIYFPPAVRSHDVFILVNLKAYDCDPVAVAEAAAAVAADADARIAVAPQAAHLAAVADTGVETWAQHVSPYGPGSHTGSTLAGAVADAGAVGTLLNHSENRLKLADIDAGLGMASQSDLETVACANNPRQVAAVSALGPDAVAVEPPELIGGDVSVASADPDIVTDAVEAAGAVDEDVAVFCGAGISTGEDVAAAAELGAEGVLLASGVAKADDPRAVLEDLVSPL